MKVAQIEKAHRKSTLAKLRAPHGVPVFCLINQQICCNKVLRLFCRRRLAVVNVHLPSNHSSPSSSAGWLTPQDQVFVVKLLKSGPRFTLPSPETRFLVLSFDLPASWLHAFHTASCRGPSQSRALSGSL